MNKNYFRFGIQLALLILVAFLIVSLVLAPFFYKKISIDFSFFFQSALSIFFVVFVMSFIFSLPSFLVVLDDAGIKKNFWSKKILWADIDHVKVIGIPIAKHFNKAVFSGRGQTVDINLFVFDDQIEFFEKLKEYLPWSESIDLKALPVEAIKRE